MDETAEARIRKLEDDLKRFEERLAETRRELAEANDLVTRQDEHVQDCHAQTERWIEAFDLQLGDDGEYLIQPPHVLDQYNDLVGDYNKLLKEHNALREKWNDIVPQWNAIVAPKMRGPGRPLAASDAQCAKVLKLAEAGKSIRSIMDETNLGMQTVRTIIGRNNHSDRTTLRHLEKINHKPIRDPSIRSRKRTRDALLSKGISDLMKAGDDIRKDAKGLGT